MPQSKSFTLVNFYINTFINFYTKARGGMMIFHKDRLKTKRKELGLTQEQLGSLINVTKASICCYEKGTRTPTLENFIDLNRVLSVGPDYLLGQEISVVIKDSPKYSVHMAKDDLAIINEIKNDQEIYEFFLQDPKRAVTFIKKKLG